MGGTFGRGGVLGGDVRAAGAPVTSVALTTLSDIKREIIGDGTKGASDALALSLQSLTDWPVDAFSADLSDTNNQSVAWIEGGVIGRITATGTYDDHELDAVIFPLAAAVRVHVVPKYKEDNNGRGSVARALTVEFASGESITVDAGRFLGQNRKNADAFITGVLSALAYPHASDL